MSTVRLEAVDIHNSNEKTGMDIPMQPASQDIWDKKYRLKSKAGDAIDADIDATYRRVAKALTVQLIVLVAGLCSSAPALEVMRPAGIAPRRSAQVKRSFQYCCNSGVGSASASALATRR